VRIGCSWCVDFGYYEAHARGMDLAKLAEVPRWQESTVFTEVERRVLEYADAVTATPPTVTDELAAALRSDLGDAALVELTMMVAVENQRSRVNAALGLASQGFSESCRVPAAR
jgi:alkylhydroperoxidase family enzyme